MAEAIRVFDGQKWAYLLVGSSAHAKASRMALSGLAKHEHSGVRLLSEHGPLFWDKEDKAEAARPPALAALLPDGILISPDESVRFGKHNGGEYNDFADMSLLSKQSPGGVPVSTRGATKGAIVLTAWPAGGTLVPAMVGHDSGQIMLDLAIPAKKGERCFVLDEDGESLITASMESDGSDKVRCLNPLAIDTWLFAAGSKAAKEKSGRFALSDIKGTEFLIQDSKTDRCYRGSYKHGDAKMPLEREHLEWLLSTHGLGGVLASYELSRG